MFINDLFKITENSNEEYYAVYDQRGRPMIMRKPVGKTAKAYAEEKNYSIKGGPFDSHQATESFWIRSVLSNKRKEVDEQAPLNVPQGWEAKTQPDGSTRISKIGSMSSADYKQSMADYKAKNWTPEKMADYSQRMASGQGYSDAERAANYQQQQQHFGQYADQPVQETEEFDDKSPHTSYVQSIRTLTNKDGDENYKHRVASVSTDKSGNQRVRALDTSRDFGDELTINTIVPKNAKIDIVPQQPVQEDDVPDEDTLQQQGSELGRFPHYYEIRDAGTAFELDLNYGEPYIVEPGHPEWDTLYKQYYDLPTPNDYGPGRGWHIGKNPVAEAGPFSYGAKKPRKGSVADLAAQKRREQERGRQPIEPKDQRVGVARVVKDVAEDISVVDQDYDLDQMHLTLDIEGKKVSFTYWDYEEDFSNAERKDVFDQLQEQPWYKGLDHPTKMEILDAAYRAIRGLEPQEYRPTIGDEPLDEQGVAEDWKKVNRKDRTPGMSRKAVKAYRRENPGSKLQTAVTTKPSKLKKGSKSAKRRKSFCARMSGMKRAHAGAKTKRDPDSPINKALRRWNCESVEEMRDLIMIAEQRISAMREGGFDIPEIPRAPQPRPQPKEPTSEDKKLSDQEKQSLRQTVKAVDYTKPSTDTKAQLSPEAKKELRQTVKDYEQSKPTNEASAREKLDRRFQELRKKRGAPDPEYYKEFAKSYDIENDQERHARQAELKKKYGVNEAKQVTSSWEVTFKDGKKKVIKANHEQGSGPSNEVVLGSVVAQNPNRKVASVKQMYTPNARTTKMNYANEDVEQYLEEMRRAGYEIVTETATLCPECGGTAYSDRMLAEKQDACYHKVKSRYKVWPSAYASGALVRCRKKGAANWGNKSKK